jgi:3-methyladenine DNA glycosylase AlkD
MTPQTALSRLRAHGDADRAAQMAAYHKTDRAVLGVAMPVIDDLARGWRAGVTLDQRLSLAAGLWDTCVFDARLAAAKLLTQARIRPDDAAAWALICDWVPQFDGWAIADAVAIAGGKRLVADPARLDTVEVWTQSDLMWTRRAALVMTLPFARLNNPKPHEDAIRARVLGWAAGYVADRDWFIQKAVGWWLRDLSRHAPDLARDWLAAHGAGLKAFARKEAARHLRDGNTAR